MIRLTIVIIFTTFMLSGCSKESNNVEDNLSQSAYLNSINVRVIESFKDNQMKVEAVDNYKEDIEQGDIIIVNSDTNDIGNRLSPYKENDIIKVYFTNVNSDFDEVNIICLDVSLVR